MQLREAVELAAARLGDSPHPERARRDAEMLLLHLTGKNRAWLLAHGDEEFGGCTAVRYASLVERRMAGEPIQHITGDVEFYGLPFRITPDVLIPRPETEHLVETAIQIVQGWEAARIVDVGTGSGAIAIALAHTLKSERVTAVELSPTAIDIARENANRNGVKARFLEGDLLEPAAGETFDLIVSNPPYVPEADRSSLSVEVRAYEPAMALFAGEDGLDIYRRLIPQAFNALVPGGHVLLEIGYGQAEAVRALLEETGFFNVRFVPDLQGIPRVVDAMRGKD
jgi:release factor glutamine methyltransferase